MVTTYASLYCNPSLVYITFSAQTCVLKTVMLNASIIEHTYRYCCCVFEKSNIVKAICYLRKSLFFVTYCLFIFYLYIFYLL